MTLLSSSSFPVIDGRLAVGLLIIVAAIIISLALNHFAQRSRKRAFFLTEAERAASRFYARATDLLDDPATPAYFRSIILDISLAVTYDKIGKRALDAILKVIGELDRTGKELNPGDAFVRRLKDLRHDHGDLYDAFHEALAASLASILFSHGLDHEKVAVSLIGNRSALLALAERLERVVGDRVRGEAGVLYPVSACA